MEEITQTAARRTALTKMKKSDQYETIQRVRATHAGNTSAGVLGHVKKLLLETDWLTARGDKLVFENEFTRDLAKNAKRSRELCVKVQRLRKEQTKSAGFYGPVRGDTAHRYRGIFVGNAGQDGCCRDARQEVGR